MTRWLALNVLFLAVVIAVLFAVAWVAEQKLAGVI